MGLIWVREMRLQIDEGLVYDQTTEQLKQLTLNVDGLSGGEHRVGIRVKDGDLGNWKQPHRLLI